jgi:hypothetical protein
MTAKFRYMTPLKTVKTLLDNLQKNPLKKPQDNQKNISFRKNIKNIVDIAMRNGGIHFLGQLSITFSLLNEIGKV